MRYVIVARDWDESLREMFGDFGSIHELSDTEIVECVKQFGRASIDKTEHDVHGVVVPKTADWYILFENAYD